MQTCCKIHSLNFSVTKNKTQKHSPLPVICTEVTKTCLKCQKDEKGTEVANQPTTHLAVIFGEHIEQEGLHIIIKRFVVKKQFSQQA
jgi:hypothetical protein